MKNTLHRFELVITKDGTDGRDHNRVETFTWGVTRTAAYARTVDTMDDPVWEGWSFELAQTPTRSL